MTSKTILWMLGLLGIAAIGYFIFQTPSQKNVQDDQVNTEQQSSLPEQTGKKMAFSTFLQNDKGSYQCRVSQYYGDVESTGTVYVASGMIRGEFKTLTGGKTITSSLLLRDGYQYVWSPQMPTGVKMAVDTPANTSTNTTTDFSGTYQWNAEQIGDYDCTPWTVDATVFALPSGVSFTDLKAMMQQIPSR